MRQRDWFLFQKINDRLPIIPADQDNRSFLHKPQLHIVHYFKKLIQRAKTAGEKDKGVAGRGQHYFARKKIVESGGLFDIGVDALFKRQLDVEADRLAADFKRAFVGGLHNARAAAGDGGETVFAQQPPEFYSNFVIFVVGRNARRTENDNFFFNVAQKLVPFNNFGYDPKNAPAVAIVHRGAGGLKMRVR